MILLSLSLRCNSQDVEYKIKEYSIIAQIAYLLHGGDAITLGGTIHYVGTTENLLKDTITFRHELCHVRQYKQYGFFGFIRKYLHLWRKYGYYRHPMEEEAIKFSYGRN